MKKNNSLKNILSSDFYKLTKLKGTYIALIIMLLLLTITFASLWIITNSIDVEDIQTSGKDYLFTSISTANIGLFIAILAGLFIGKEFSDGIMRLTIARGYDKCLVYLSKLIVLFSLVIVYSIIILIIAGIFTAITGYGEQFNGNQFAILMRMLGLEVLALISSASIFTMLAFLFRSSGSTIGASIGFYLIITIIASVLSAVSMAYMLTDTDKANVLIKASYFLPYQQSSIASTTGDIGTTELIAAIVMPIVYTFLSTLIGILSFIKRDIR